MVEMFWPMEMKIKHNENFYLYYPARKSELTVKLKIYKDGNIMGWVGVVEHGDYYKNPKNWKFC